MTSRLLALVLIAGLLSGCGFHLRNSLNLPENLGPVRVLAVDRYSPLADMLSDGLARAGALSAPVDATDVATLQVVSEEWVDTPISHDQFGRAQEYALRYAVVFSMKRADGSDAVPQQAVELSRDYVSPPEDATGTSTEREILADELRREMAASILRRIDGVARARAATTAAGAGPAEAAASPEPEPEPTP